jgi:phospholipid/cholesterol/gamma-HCH transport system substrate-binding protein
MSTRWIHTRWTPIALAAVLVVVLAGGGYVLVRSVEQVNRTNVVAYFENSNGIFVGDDVRIRGVNVGKIDAIEPQPTRVKISFWVDDSVKVPVKAKAVILSPTLVTARAIQLTPPYRSGPALADNAVIPQDRTAVPVEFDDFRAQLKKLSQTLQPTEPGGVSTLGAFINTSADNLRGEGPAMHDAIVKLSQAVSALGDHSADTFGTVKNLATLVSALQGSTDLIRQLNRNLASVSGLVSNDPGEISDAVKNLNDVVGEVKTFVAANRESVGITADKLTSVSQALTDSLGDIKQLLHVSPTTLDNAINIYQPAQGTLTGALAVNNFANPISFLCGAIQAASRLNADKSSKLCVQYLAPIIKNRQYNFPPIGENLFVGASARPNEVTYSEPWMRPDYVPPRPPAAASPPTVPGRAAPLPGEAPHPGGVPLAAEVQPSAVGAPPAQATDPNAGLRGMMATPAGVS